MHYSGMYVHTLISNFIATFIENISVFLSFTFLFGSQALHQLSLPEVKGSVIKLSFSIHRIYSHHRKTLYRRDIFGFSYCARVMLS